MINESTISQGICPSCNLPAVGLDPATMLCKHCSVSEYTKKGREVGTVEFEPSLANFMLEHPVTIALAAVAFGILIFLLVRSI